MTHVSAPVSPPKLDPGRPVRLKKGLGKRLALAFIGLWLILTLVSMSGVSVKITRSESLNHSVFLLRKADGPFAKGEYAAFRAPPNPYLSGEFLKIVKGVPGDEVRIEGDIVFVNDQMIGRAKPQTKMGRPLSIIESGIIPDDFYFMGGVHTDSFDSRYGEIGLVHKSNMTAKAKVIF